MKKIEKHSTKVYATGRWKSSIRLDSRQRKMERFTSSSVGSQLTDELLEEEEK